MNGLTFLIFIPVVFVAGFFSIIGIIDITSKSKNKYVDNAGFFEIVGTIFSTIVFIFSLIVAIAALSGNLY